MHKAIEKVTTITSLGGGPIGAGWAAHFLARGYKVKSFIYKNDERKIYNKIIKTAWKSLKEIGISENASLDNLSISTDIHEAISDTDFVQESIPEILNVKREFYKLLGAIVPSDIIIASSTSGLTMTDIQKSCDTPERTVIGHPFNPPYLLPLVEIVGGKKTSPLAVNWTKKFYAKAGKEPLVMNKEVPGFIATRLQEALWREALHMVKSDEATPEQIDTALKNGPAPRMAVQGQCMAFHVACGEGGMATNLDQFGPALKLPWTRLKAPELTPVLRNKMVDACNSMAKGKSFEQLAKHRDDSIVAILKAIKNSEIS